MTITLHLHITTVWFPISVTLLAIAITGFVGARESKSCGDYGLPIMTFGCFCAGAAASLIAWLFYLGALFLK